MYGGKVKMTLFWPHFGSKVRPNICEGIFFQCFPQPCPWFQVITEYVYDLLESKAGLRRLELVPAGAEGAVDEPRSHVFVSPDLAVNQEKLLILIHGSGVVRAGQWARRCAQNCYYLEFCPIVRVSHRFSKYFATLSSRLIDVFSAEDRALANVQVLVRWGTPCQALLIIFPFT